MYTMVWGYERRCKKKLSRKGLMILFFIFTVELEGGDVLGSTEH